MLDVMTIWPPAAGSRRYDADRRFVRLTQPIGEREDSAMILEGIVTTLNGDRSVNVAPMGPIVDETMQTLLLRPFQTSTTYRNLKRTGCGVLHVTDDVLLLAQAAINRLERCAHVGLPVVRV
jgi:hypothetical protein